MAPKHPVYAKYDNVDDLHWKCKVCGKLVRKNTSGSPTGLVRHMNTHEKPEEESTEPPPKQQKLSFAVVDSREGFESAVLGFFAAYGVPFEAVESSEFKSLFTYPYKTITRRRLSEDVLVRDAAKCDSIVTMALRHQHFAVCFDEYTKGIRRFVSLTAVYVDDSFTLNTVRVAVRSLESERATAENLQTLIKDALIHHQLPLDSVIAMTRDGGANIKKTADLLGLNSVHCFDHFLHLCVKDGLRAPEVDAIVKKIQSVAVAFKSSALAEQKFHEFSNGSSVKMCNLTRWNSTYRMIKSFVELQEPLTAFSSDSDGRKTSAAAAYFATMNMDIEEIRSLCKLLKIFEEISLMAEGRSSSASMIFYLLRVIKEYCSRPTWTQSALTKSFLEAFKLGLRKRESEYSTNDLLLICSFLDPRFVGDSLVAPDYDWERAAHLICAQFPDVAEHEDQVVPNSDPINEQNDEEWPAWSNRSQDENVVGSPIEQETKLYRTIAKNASISAPKPTEVKTSTSAVLAFWKTNKKRLPLLSGLAKKYFAVCASSAEPERVFSNLTHLLSNPKRANLSSATVTRLMTVRQNIAMRKLEKRVIQGFIEVDAEEVEAEEVEAEEVEAEENSSPVD
uniref:BED-type domain-containing protein n=1 Tax=Steinernema glaseri TaxID=37863 RepID=A0A1I7ZLP5_9BILA